LLALISAFAFTFAANAVAQTKPRIEKAADLPRFSYKVEGNVEDVDYWTLLRNLHSFWSNFLHPAHILLRKDRC
jgi:hypothetical protein